MFALKQINFDLVGLKLIWCSLEIISQVAIIHFKLYRDEATNAMSSFIPRSTSINWTNMAANSMRFNRSNKASIYQLRKSGEITAPCLTPLDTQKALSFCCSILHNNSDLSTCK